MSKEEYFDDFSLRRMGPSAKNAPQFVVSWAQALETLKMRLRDISVPADDWMLKFSSYALLS